MEISKIVEELDAEIGRLTQVRNLLAGGNGDNVPSLDVTRKPGKKRTLSAEARERIAAAQRARWAKKKKAAKKAA